METIQMWPVTGSGGEEAMTGAKRALGWIQLCPHLRVAHTSGVTGFCRMG